MSRSSEREQTLESLLESLIKMLGKSNQRVDDLQKRVIQLELFLRESVLQRNHTNPHARHHLYNFTN